MPEEPSVPELADVPLEPLLAEVPEEPLLAEVPLVPDVPLVPTHNPLSFIAPATNTMLSLSAQIVIDSPSFRFPL